MSTFSAYWTEQLGVAIKAAALVQCPEFFRITASCADEQRVIIEAWNEGIDSYLQGFTQSSVFGESGKLSLQIHPTELSILVRRLMTHEYENDELTDSADSLASGICETLGIELV